jgi:hypothetical protein
MQLLRGIKPLHYTTYYYFSLALLAGSLPLSKFTMSVFQFTTLFFWLWHEVDTGFLVKYRGRKLARISVIASFAGDLFRQCGIALLRKFVRFFGNKPALILSSLFLLHVLGLLYTTDFGYAFKDLRTKLPLFILPLFIATGPKINTRTLYFILGCYVAAVLGGSIYRLILFLNLPVADSRSLAAHTSHIRYSLNAVYAIFILLYFVFSNQVESIKAKVVFALLIVWIGGFIAFMHYTTGLVILLIVLMIILLRVVILSRNNVLKAAIVFTMSIIIIVPAVFVTGVVKEYLNKPAIDFRTLDKYTQNGNSYYHDTVNFKTNNGNWIGLYICEKELQNSWKTRSSLNLDSLDGSRQITRFTLIKYLASKNLRKDAQGVSQLTVDDIKNIEKGINRMDYNRLPGLKIQIEEFIESYQRYIAQNDPNSGSLVQRLEYWRTSLLLVRQHPAFGVGTGDLPDAFARQYVEMDSHLAPHYRLRSHNQYLSIMVAFGIAGFVWFLFTLIYPGFKTRKFGNYFYLVYWLIVMISMLTEDTIESQEGVTFYILFAAIFLTGLAASGKPTLETPETKQ